MGICRVEEGNKTFGPFPLSRDSQAIVKKNHQKGRTPSTEQTPGSALYFVKWEVETAGVFFFLQRKQIGAKNKRRKVSGLDLFALVILLTDQDLRVSNWRIYNSLFQVFKTKVRSLLSYLRCF